MFELLYIIISLIISFVLSVIFFKQEDEYDKSPFLFIWIVFLFLWPIYLFICFFVFLNNKIEQFVNNINITIQKKDQ